MQIGDVVKIRPSKSWIDCCQGKRGRIAHVGVGGGWLLCTDHFCPIERSDDELELIPELVLAQEVYDRANPVAQVSYMSASTETLEAYEAYDPLAHAVLIIRRNLKPQEI